MYRVEIKTSAAKQIRNLDKVTQFRIGNAIDELQTDPKSKKSKLLVGTKNIYRIRVGDYRIIYQIQKEVLLVIVVKIAHRKEVYR